ncbi:MAG: N-acetyl-gamma-glutamyl-phosphate reductase [Oscillospiraceae bacterium]|jgi:N-acetyl-gamma-glutamyl-phosphate reductase|nr:N-acetyl-gamma-glutamyl-phosphate reductase [Oscillospiraceae bacterium]
MIVFIDGREGTTGLRIEQRLAARQDIRLLTLSESQRKNPAARAEALAAADVAFLCLPDAAAREAVSLLGDGRAVLIDASAAHRTAPGWAYGFPELGPAFREAIRRGTRVAVPGCHASGFLALTAPLRRAGLLPRDALLHCFSLTGYTGGGKSMIAAYESGGRVGQDPLAAPRQYALGQSHKHLPEMRTVANLAAAPLFCPVVADFDCGMEVTVPLHRAQLSGSPAAASSRRDPKAALLDCYRAAYRDEPLILVGAPDEDGFLSAGALRGRDSMELTVEGSSDRLLLIARFDNLGKGASGAAVQCLNLVLGAPETEGLCP